MVRGVRRIAGPILVVMLVLVPQGVRAADEKAEVREAFTTFQAALKAQDAGKLWKLLDTDSRTAAERAAKAVKAAHAKATPEGKAKLEKALGLSGAELGALTGEGFLKTKRFQAKYGEVPDSKINTIDVQGDSATVNYTEADGDKEKLRLNRQQGEWKVSAPMPPVAQ
jgi:hypothetical protein